MSPTVALGVESCTGMMVPNQTKNVRASAKDKMEPRYVTVTNHSTYAIDNNRM